MIAKLDRLARNAAFLLTLRDSGVRFLAMEMPEANELTAGIMALVASRSVEAISRPIKEALSAASSRGLKLGNPNKRRGAQAGRKGRRGAPQGRHHTDAFTRDPGGGGERRPRGVTRLAEIVAKLRQVDVLASQGQSVAEAVRSIGVTQFTCYRWRKEYGGLKTDQVRRLKDLEKENERLRKAVSDLTPAVAPRPVMHQD